MTELWVAVSSKPINIAAQEKLPIVEASIIVSALDESQLVELMKEAIKRIEHATGDN